MLFEVARGIRNFTYQPEKGRFRDWLGTIAWRRIARHWNSQKKGSAVADSQASSSPIDPEWIDEFQSAILRSALDNIRARYTDQTWQAFLLTWKYGEAAAQVAVRLGIPIEVVYNAKSRILKHLETEVLRIADDCAWLPE